MNTIEPAVLILLLLATVYGALAHLFWGTRWRHLPIFWGAAFVGCLVSYGLGIQIIRAGPAPANVPLVETSVAAWLSLLVASRLRV